MTAVDSLYLSPHLDDVGLSCSARLSQERREGRRILVATVFSKGGPDERARKREDRTAIGFTGSETRWLDLLDAPAFNPRFHTFRSICLGPERRDPALLPALRRLLEETRPERVYAPLGVGTHVDHRAVHRAIRRLRPEELYFYEERPYAFLRGSVAMRMTEIKAHAPGLPRASRREFLESVERTAFLRTYLGADERDACLRILLRRLEAPKRSPSLALTPVVVKGSLAAAEAVARAYRSQFDILFGRTFRRDSKECGPERFWRVEN